MNLLPFVVAAACTMGLWVAQPQGQPAGQPKDKDKAQPGQIVEKAEHFKVLVFSKTGGFRHDSIPDGIAAIRKLGTENGFGVDATEDSAQFTADNLDNYACVVFLSTTGNDILDGAQKQAFEAFIASGKGYVGVHAAADTEYTWPWYGQLVGAYFKSHPQIQEARITVEDRTHPSTAHLEDSWIRTDEWYNYKKSPREEVDVLLSLVESSYKGGENGDDHPTCWCREFGGGRAWYTGGGHTKESYAEDAFLKHLLGGIRWAAGNVEWSPKKDEAPPRKAEN